MASSAVHPSPTGHALALTDGCHCCRRIGNNVLLCGPQRSRRGWPFQWIVGPGRCGVASSYFLILFCLFCRCFSFLSSRANRRALGYAAFLGLVGPRVHLAVACGGAANAAVLLSVFMSVSCADPGIVYAEPEAAAAAAEAGYNNRCDRCDLARPRGARHCYDCGVCVMDLDHHCPLTGKCIGAKNADRFQLLLITVAASLLFLTFVTVSVILRGS